MARTDQMSIGCRHDLFDYLGVDDEQDADRRFYKDTACGGRLTVDEDGGGVLLSTIVEGSDAEFVRHLSFPFTGDEFKMEVDDLEEQAHLEWCRANQSCTLCHVSTEITCIECGDPICEDHTRRNAAAVPRCLSCSGSGDA